MTTEYEEFQEAAQDILGELGQSITFTRTSSDTYTPGTLTNTLTAPTEFTGVGWPTRYRTTELDNTEINQDDIKLWFYSTTPPEVGDSFAVDAKDYRAMNVEKYTVQGECVIRSST